MSQLWANNARTTLNGAITSGATSLVVADASKFPVITNGNYFYATLADAGEASWEIVKVTATSGTAFTVTRAQDGTTALGWASGVTVELRPCAQGMRDMVAPIPRLSILVNLIPLVRCVITASSWYPTVPPAGVFDNLDSGWVTNSTGLSQPQWVSVTMRSPRTVRFYEILPWSVDTWPARCITAWTFEGSNDGTNWTVLDTQSRTIGAWTQWLAETFTIANPQPFIAYRLNITANGGNALVGVQHLGLYEY